MTDMQPLHPLDFGKVLVVGMKATNLPEELREHPRVIVWSSQEERWTDKDIPSNTRAVFITRWISHVDFNNIIKQARKRGITVFNQEGTGLITKRIRELLSLNKTEQQLVEEIAERPISDVTVEERNKAILAERNESTMSASKQGKLDPLRPLIDWNKSRAENARLLLKKATELGIETTEGSIAQMIYSEARKLNKDKNVVKIPEKELKRDTTVDIAVQLLDTAIQELKDVRQYLIQTTNENRVLKTRISRFKSLLSDE